MTGSRIMCTLLNGLEDADNTIGLESMCVGRRPGHGHDRRTPQLTAGFSAPKLSGQARFG